ncbi:Sugar transporter STL1 [Diaporthe eres]|nr:Sugar transporter STL1 [Diaporthe eres]
MGYSTWWKRLSAKQLNLAIQTFSLISIFFEGYDQGVMGGVNASPRYVETVGCIFALVGGVLQAATQSSDFIIVPRVVTGIGTGTLTGITPVMVAEISTAEHRGGFLGYAIIANYLGISVAYWLSFGLAFVDGGYSEIRWRFQLAFQGFPALLLFLGIKMLPDTPRYLASAGRFESVRGEFGPVLSRDLKPFSGVN